MDDGANKIRMARELKGLTQLELAERSGISRQMIGHIETGRKGVSYPTARAIGKALGVGWKSIYTGSIPAHVMSQLVKDCAK